jgi:hypothetical protein
MSRGQQGGGFEQRWQNSVDDRMAELEDRMYETALILRGIQEWQRGHDKYHGEQRQNQSAMPRDVRDWIMLAIGLLGALVALGVINPR